MRFHPWHLLLAEVAVVAVIVLVGIILILLGWSHPAPAPMVTNIQLPDTGAFNG